MFFPQWQTNTPIRGPALREGADGAGLAMGVLLHVGVPGLERPLVEVPRVGGD